MFNYESHELTMRTSRWKNNNGKLLWSQYRLMERCPKADFFCLQQLYASYGDWCNFGIKLVPQVPTRQLLAWDWYWFKSYQFGWFFDIKISTNLYIKVLAWYLPNIGLYQCWFFFKKPTKRVELFFVSHTRY